MHVPGSRPLSFLIVFFVYLLAAGAGILFCAVCPLPVWANVLLADVLATVIVFCFSLIFSACSLGAGNAPIGAFSLSSSLSAI